MKELKLFSLRKQQEKIKAKGEICCISGCYNKIDPQGRYFGYKTCKGHRHLEGKSFT